jgi:hypothetical protein
MKTKEELKALKETLDAAHDAYWDAVNEIRLKELKDKSDINRIIFEALMVVPHDSDYAREAFSDAMEKHNEGFKAYTTLKEEMGYED